MAFTNTMRFTGLSGIDTTSMVDSMMKVESLKYDALYKKNMTYSYKHEAYQSVGNKLVDIQNSKFNILASGSLRSTSTYIGNKSTVTDSSGNASNAVTVNAGNSSKNKMETDMDIKQLATNDTYILTSNPGVVKTADTTMGEMFGTEPGSNTGSITINGKTMQYGDTTKVDDVVNFVNKYSGDATIKHNSFTNNYEIKSTKSGADNKLVMSGSSELSSRTSHVAGTGTDAIVVFGNDPTEVHYSTNTIALENGGSMQLNSTGKVHVKVEEDTAYTNAAVHDFVDTYNSILQAIYDQTETGRPKSSGGSYYQPLTDEERSAMSDSDLVKWDENAKKGLLYKDEDLRNIENKLRTAMSKPVTLSDGTKMSLGDLGISLDTGDITQRGKLVIDDDKLNKAINKYGSGKIAAVFTSSASGSNEGGYAERVNSILTKTVGPNGSLTQKVGLNSNKMDLVSNEMSKKEIQNARDLADLQTKLAKKETWYYKMFSNMETQIQKSNQQLASLG